MLGDVTSVDEAVADAQSAYDLPSALSFIVQQFPTFSTIGGVIVGWQHAAALQKVRALQLGRSDIASQMDSEIATLGSLDTMAGNVLDEIDALDSGLRSMGLDPSTGQSAAPSAIPDSAFGQEPVTIAAALALAVVIVGYMTWVLTRTNTSAQAITAQTKVLDMIASKAVTPTQGTAMLKTLADTSAQTTQTGLAGVMNAVKSLAIPAAVVAVAVFVVPEVSKHIGRRR